MPSEGSPNSAGTWRPTPSSPSRPLTTRPGASTRAGRPRAPPPPEAAAPDPYAAAARTRCRAAFVRFPQIRIEHHWLERLRERS